MEFRTRERLGPGWLRQDALRELRRINSNDTTLGIQRATSAIERAPTTIALLVQAVIFGVSILFTVFPVSVLPELAPTNVDGLLATAWQVHASFVAIAFAGLVMLFQSNSSEVLVSAEMLRSILFKDTRLRLTLAYSMAGILQLGAASIWFPSDATLFAQVVGTIGLSMLLIARAYLRTNNLLSNPGVAYDKTRQELKKRIRESIERSRAEVLAKMRLETAIPRRWQIESEGPHLKCVWLEDGDALIDVNLDALHSIQADLDAIASRHVVGPSDTGGATHDDYRGSSPVLTMLMNIGNKAKGPGPVFLIETRGQPVNQAEYERRLRQAISIEESHDKFTILEQELHMLRDAIVESLSRGEQRRAQRGLQMLREALLEVPRVYGQLHSISNESVSWKDERYGSEWDELLAIAWDCQSLAKEIMDGRVRHDLLVVLFELVVDALAQKDAMAAMQLSDTLASTWAEMAPIKGAWTVADSSYFLTRLREIVYWVAEDATFDRRAALVLTRLYVNCAKAALDNHDRVGCREILDILGDINRHMSNDDRKKEFNRLHLGVQLILIAWWLKVASTADKESTADIDQWFGERTFMDDIVAAVKIAHDAELADVLHWRWWEMPAPRGRVVVVSHQMSTYIDLAALELLRNGDTAFPVDTTEESAALARRMISLVDQGMFEPYAGDSRSNTYLVDMLRRHIDIWSEHESEVLASKPLDVTNILRFCEEVEQRFIENDSLVSQVSVDIDDNGDTRYGYNGLVHKSLFVSNGGETGVSILAEDLVRAMKNWEEDELLDIVLDHPSTATTLDRVSESVAEWVSSQQRDHVVLGTNSWAAYTNLMECHLVDDVKALRRVYGGDGMYVFGFVTPAGISIERRKLEDHARDGHALAGGRLLARVELLSPEEVGQIMESNPENDELVMRQHVRVNLFESIRLVVPDPGRIRVWRLPDSVY